MDKSFYLISYDIADDRRRTKIAHALEGYGTRVQYSVFELWLSTSQLARLRKRLEKLVEEEGSIRIYCLCSTCQKTRQVLGEGEPSSQQDVLII